MARLVSSAVLPELGQVIGAPLEVRAWIDHERVRRRADEHLGSGMTRESWKYTPIKGFLEALRETPSEPAAQVVGGSQPGVRAVPFSALTAEDEVEIRRAIAGRLVPERHVLADLALLRARSGWWIEVSGDVSEPLEIQFPTQGIVPVFVRLGPNTSATLVERPWPESSATSERGLLAQVIHVELGSGARLVHERAALDRDRTHYAAVSVRLDHNARYRLGQSAVGSKRRRLEVHAVLDADGAELEMDGAYLVENGQHLDQQFLVEHRAGHTTSHQKFHGIGAGKSRSVFNGRIHIHPKAPQSDAALTNRNLALHADAEMNTKPELEIYTDDVRCSHGATVGRLDDDALFYLTARGIPEADARRLLAQGFVRECLSGQLAEAVLARFMEALR